MNIYIVTSLVAFVVCSFLGCFVYSKSKGENRNKLFALVSILTGIWCLFPFLTSIAKNDAQALKWARVVYIAAIFDAPVFLAFAFSMMNIEKTKKARDIMRAVYVISFFFLPFLFSPLFIQRIECSDKY